MSGDTVEIPADLVDRARRGDEAALGALVERAYPHVRRWSLVHTGDGAEADDLTQDVLIQMIGKLDGFRGDSRFMTWLHAVARNAATDRIRRRRRRERMAEDAGRRGSLVPPRVPSPAHVAESRQLGALLRAFFEDLPARQREIFDLVELRGMSASEVAERLAIAPATVRAHLFKARRHLRLRILTERPELVEDLK